MNSSWTEGGWDDQLEPVGLPAEETYVWVSVATKTRWNKPHMGPTSSMRTFLRAFSGYYRQNMVPAVPRWCWALAPSPPTLPPFTSESA